MIFAMPRSLCTKNQKESFAFMILSGFFAHFNKGTVFVPF